MAQLSGFHCNYIVFAKERERGRCRRRYLIIETSFLVSPLDRHSLSSLSVCVSVCVWAQHMA